jgi:LuxR family maltose regulon positive regulatory protein
MPAAFSEMLAALEVWPSEMEFVTRLRDLLPPQQTPQAGKPAPQAAHSREPVAGFIEPLSARELEVLGLLADGLTNLQIAARLVISAGTVKAHTANIFRKLDAANRTQAVTKAREIGVI